MAQCQICGDELDPVTGTCRRSHEIEPAEEVFLAADAGARKPRRVGAQWVVIAAVLGGLAICGGVIVPIAWQQRESARRSTSRYHLKAIGLALHNYHEVFTSLPPGGIFDAREKPFYGWGASIMPNVDAAPDYNRINFNVPWNDPSNAAVFRRPVPYYLNPSVAKLTDDQGYFLMHYAANKQLMFPNSSTRFSDITDGLQNTILMGEIAEGFLPFAQPGSWRDPAAGINAGPQTFGQPGGDGVQFLMCDGSVRWISNSVDLKLLRALSTPAGGEQVDNLP